MEKLSVYLSGPITEVSEEEAWKWRNSFKEKYADRFEEIKNPLDRDSRYKHLSGENLYAAIANGERKDILNCDALIAKINCPSMGTAMGIMYAYLSGRTVVVVKNKPTQKLSKMVLHHAHKICNNVDEAVNFIEKRHKRENIKKITRRDGSMVDWDQSKIVNAIQAAINDIYSNHQMNPGVTPPKSEKLATTVVMQIEDALEANSINDEELNIEAIQDMVEKVLMDNAHRSEVHTLSKAYIIYRRKRQEYREGYMEDSEIKRFIQEILHDFKSPVANIKRNCEFLEEALNSDDIEETKAIIKSILNVEKELEDSISSIKTKSENKYQKSVINTKDIIEDLIQSYGGNKKVTFHKEIEEDAIVESPPAKIKTIFKVLIDNSIKHGFKENNGNIYIKVHKKNKGNLRIQYWNDQENISKKKASTIFFGEKNNNSTNQMDFQFGLTQIKSYVEQLAGTIDCLSVNKAAGDFENLELSETGYPVFLIDLPIYRGRSIDDLRSILIADDNANDRDMIRRILSKNKYNIIETESIDRALQIVKNKSIFGAVIDVDFKSDSDGIWLLKEIKKISPQIRTVVVSGLENQPGQNWQEKAKQYGAFEVFDKSKYYPSEILRCFSQ